jgi:hypothetical protein
MRIDEEAKHNARWRHRGKELIWRTRLEMEECNLNQRAQ